MKTKFKTLPLLFFALVLTFSSCDDDNDPTNNICNNTFVDFVANTAFTTANGYSLNETYDVDIHEYKLQINADGEICTIGYKSPPTFSGTYKMEILSGTNTVLYSGIHSFSQNNIDYQAITPVPISGGTTITVRRTVLSGATNTSHLIGQIFSKTDGSYIPYPIPLGNVLIIESSLYDIGTTPATNARVLPYIGIGFKLN